MNRRPVPVAIGFLMLLMAAPAVGPTRAQSVIAPPASVHLANWPVAVKPNDIAADPETGALAVIDAGNSRITVRGLDGEDQFPRLPGADGPAKASRRTVRRR